MKQIRLKLDRYLDERQISRYALAQMTGIRYPIIDGYYKNKVTRYDSYNLSKVLTVLNCGLEDIFEIVEIEDE